MTHLKMTGNKDQKLGQNPFGKKRFAATLILTLVTLSMLVYTNWRSYRFFDQMFIARFNLMEINSKIPQLDVALTMSVSMAAATGDPRWKVRYDSLETQLDSIILLVRKITRDFSFGTAAVQIDRTNQVIYNLEKEAFKLVQSGNLKEAAAILTSAEYADEENNYKRAFHQMQAGFWNFNLSLLKKERFKLIFSLISTLILFPLLLITWYSVLTSIRKYFNEGKEAEDSLNKFAKRFQDLVENLNDVIFTLEINGNITFVNEQVYDLSGYKPEELIGQPFTKIIYEKDIQQIYLNFQNTLENKPGTSEYRYITKNGEIRWAQTRGYPILKDGEPTGINGIFSDITERKKAQEDLADSESFFRSIIDSTEDLIYSVDSETFGLLTFNKGMIDYFKPSGIQIRKGTLIEEMIPEENARKIRSLYNQTIKDGFVTQIYGADWKNKILWITLHLLSKDNKPYAISVFAKDITEMKESETRIQNQLEELQRWNQATINREERILELKQQVNELLGQAGKPPIYENY